MHNKEETNRMHASMKEYTCTIHVHIIYVYLTGNLPEIFVIKNIRFLNVFVNLFFTVFTCTYYVHVSISTMTTPTKHIWFPVDKLYPLQEAHVI